MADIVGPIDLAAERQLGRPSPDYDVQLESLNQWQIAWRRFKRHRMALIGSTMFFGMVLIGVDRAVHLPVRPLQDPASRTFGSMPAGRPASAHLFGETGRLQRDVLTLVVNGIRYSLLIGVIASAIGAIVGTIVGGVAGYFGGWTDTILMRIVDALLSLPLLFVILVVQPVPRTGRRQLGHVTIIFGLFGWLGIARLVRAVILSLREADYVDAARAAGVSRPADHLPPPDPELALADHRRDDAGRGGVIIGEAFVSFLGFGVDPAHADPAATSSAVRSSSSARATGGGRSSPGASIVVIVLGINFMGDGLRDALDPRSKI